MKITFFCRIKNKAALEQNLFYKQDIDILRSMDPDLVIATSYREIDWKSDLIFVWWWTYALVPVSIARLLGKKTIITGTFNYRAPNAPNDYFRRNFVQKFVLKAATLLTNRNVFVSKCEHNEIMKDWSLKNDSYIPHGIYHDKYTFNSERKSNEVLTLCWLHGTNIKRKCIMEILDAAVLVVKDHPDVQFILAGRSGDSVDLLQERIKTLKLENNVCIKTDLTEQEKIILQQNCTIYLQPSHYEGFGVANAEAMSCGTAVIATDAGEVKNVIGDAGVLLPDNEIGTIYSAVTKLLGDKQKRAQYGRLARQRIVDHFTVDMRKGQLLKLIKDLFS